MKKKLLVAFCFFSVVSCTSDKNEEAENTSSLVEEKAEVTAYTEGLVNEILGSGEKTIRGFDLGDPISLVKKREKLEKFEESEELLGYTFEISEFEIVDVLYLYDASNVINEVQLDIYLDTDSASNEMMESLVIHFTQKYGKPKQGISQPTWDLGSSQIVTIEDIKAKLDRGLQVRFKKAA